MRRSALLLASSAVFWSAGGLASDELPLWVSVRDEMSACYTAKEDDYAFRWDGSGYRGPLDVGAREVEELVAALEASREWAGDDELDLEEARELLEFVGVSAGRAALRAGAAFESAREEGLSEGEEWPVELPVELTHYLDGEALRRTLEHELLHSWKLAYVEVMYGGRSLILNLEGNEGWKISSSSNRLGMLPWIVEKGDESWTTWDPRLPDRIAPFVKSGGANGKLVRFEEYLREEVWRDGWLWRYKHFPDLDQFDRAAGLFRALPGYANALDEFRLERASMLRGRKGSAGLSFVVSARNDRLVDRVRWRIPVHRGEPQRDWNDLLSVLGTIEAGFESNHEWLGRWKALAPTRRVELDMDGARAALFREARKDWRRAGLPDEKFVRLELSGKGAQAEILVSRSSLAALATYAKAGSGDAWFERDGAWTVADRTCVRRDANGNVEPLQL